MSNSLYQELSNNAPRRTGIMDQVNMIKNDPSQLGQILFQKGKISQQQLSAIQGMNPSQIGQYLVRNGILGNAQVNQFGSMIGQMFH